MGRAAGSLASWGVLGGLAVAVAAQPAGCTGGSGEALLDAEVQAALQQVGPGVVLPALDAFLATLDPLDQALADRAADLADGTDEDGAGAVQAAFLEAFLAWQALELLQIGPLGSSLTAVGGQDLRDEVYSWPTANPCVVDQVTAGGRYEDPGFFDVELVPAYGLDALEHLLFAGPENACPGQVPPNSDGAWDELGATAVTQARAEYALVVAGGLRASAQLARDAWDPATAAWWGGLDPADPGAPFEGTQEALNAVLDALFYLETTTKDAKLAEPLGLGACTGSGCAAEVEARASGASLGAIRANLLSFRQLFTGADGTGMDDVLTSKGHADLVDAVLTGLDAALVAADAVPEPLEQAVATSPAAVEALHGAVKVVTDVLKLDLPVVLALEVPGEASGDND